MKSSRRLILSGSAAIAAAALVALPIIGQSAGSANSSQIGAFERYGGVADRFNLRGGPLFATHRTLARVDSEQLGVGTLVDLEHDLGLESSTQNARFDGYIRLGRRHQVRAGYISLSRGASVQLDRQIQWGDEIFDLNVGVETRLDLLLIPVAYRFSVVKSERVDLGVSAGAFALFADARVAAPSAGIDQAESASFPLPVFGADVDIAVAPKVFIVGGVEYFALSIEQLHGSWSEFRGGIEFFPYRHFGVGIVYRHVNLEIDTTGALDGASSDTEIFFDYEFRGPQVYLTVAF